MVPSRQKKTAAVAGDVESDEDDEVPATKGRKRKAADESAVDVPASKKSGKGKKEEANGVETVADEKKTKKKNQKTTPKKAEKPPTTASRRSTRNSLG